MVRIDELSLYVTELPEVGSFYVSIGGYGYGMHLGSSEGGLYRKSLGSEIIIWLVSNIDTGGGISIVMFGVVSECKRLGSYLVI